MQPDSTAPWVLIAAGFHKRGGMDKANLALAEYLLDRGTRVHVVSHSAEPPLQNQPLATLHVVERPYDSYFLGDLRLNLRGPSLIRSVVSQYPAAHVVVNGGICRWTDINWVHSVHHAWPCFDDGAPAWFKLKNRLTKWTARWTEGRALRTARLVLANSEKTKHDLIERLGIPAQRIHVVYLGSDPMWRPPGHAERVQARQRFEDLGDRPLVVFVGALSHDHNKGFDTLWRAWQALCARKDWDGRLVVAGGGSGVAHWRRESEKAGLSHTVKFLGFTTQVEELLSAADLLISPVRYEAYGLNVQEAICHGVPAMVSASAGIAERYPAECRPLLIPNPADSADLIGRLLEWRPRREEWKSRFQSFGDALRNDTWNDMCRRIVSIVNEAKYKPAGATEHIGESLVANG